MATPHAPDTADLAVDLIGGVSSLTFADIPGDVIDAVKLRILDYCAAAVAGITADGIQAVRELAGRWGGRPESSVVGSDLQLPAPLAALVNASTGRALELDDVHESALLHPTVATVPVAIAAAEARKGVDGRTFLSAVTAAQEAMCRLGLSPEYHVSGDQHRPRGMSYTYQCGVLGGALAAGKVLGLDESELADAFGNAFTAIAGNQQAIQEGVLAIRIQQGVTAQTALQSAYFAEAGISGPRQSLEGKFGWLSYWHDGRYDPSAVMGEWGKRWEAANVSIKPYPTCRITHNAVTATMAALRDNSLSPSDVERMVVHVNSRESWEEVVEPADVKRRPRSSMEAQFSLVFACAIAAVRGGVTLGDLTEQALADPEVLAMAAKIEPVLDPESDVSQGRVLPMPVDVDVYVRGGTKVEARSEFPLGHPHNPMSWEEVSDKLRMAAEWSSVISEKRVGEIIETVASLEKLDDVGALGAALGTR